MSYSVIQHPSEMVYSMAPCFTGVRCIRNLSRRTCFEPSCRRTICEFTQRPLFLDSNTLYSFRPKDIIGWDPRGIISSSPNVTCFDTSLEEHIFRIGGFAADHLDLPVHLPSHGQAKITTQDIKADLVAQLTRKRASAKALFERCVAKTGDVAAFFGTANVVKGVFDIHKLQRVSESAIDLANKDLDYIDRLLYGGVPLNYYGISYGVSQSLESPPM